MSDRIIKFISRLECRDGAQIASVQLDKSEYHAYRGDRYAILTINSEGKVEDIKYLQHFGDVSEIRPFVKSLNKNYVAGKFNGDAVSWIIDEGEHGRTFEEVVKYLEEEFLWEGSLTKNCGGLKKG